MREKSQKKWANLLDGFLGIFGFFPFVPPSYLSYPKNPCQGFEADIRALQGDWQRAVSEFQKESAANSPAGMAHRARTARSRA